MASTDQPALNAMDEVAADMLKQAGINLDYEVTD